MTISTRSPGGTASDQVRRQRARALHVRTLDYRRSLARPAQAKAVSPVVVVLDNVNQLREKT